nr:MAG TPA: hypothetical protein [Caudoviricetes sp.]
MPTAAHGTTRNSHLHCIMFSQSIASPGIFIPKNQYTLLEVYK